MDSVVRISVCIIRFCCAYLKNRSTLLSKRWEWLAIVVVACCGFVRAEGVPYHQTDFPTEEFKARWEVVFNKIGDHAVAIVQGAPRTNGFIFPRQTNDFYYMCGIETPGSYILLDGRTHKVTLYLPARDARQKAKPSKRDARPSTSDKAAAIAHDTTFPMRSHLTRLDAWWIA